ncbi:MAG TPA: hypothetical protein VMU11_04445 [Verrucomicrobiae bacterium]|nr:hypothetical protein [Verrucomicrobiae bacterium]
MKQKELNPVLHSLGHAVLLYLYVMAVAFGLAHTQQVFGGVQEPNFLIPVAMLMLLVLSATISGTLVLARPILMYWDGKKKEALAFFGMTVGWLALLTVLAFTVLYFAQA